MSRDEVWKTYIETTALLAKAESYTTAARQALEDAEAEEESLRQCAAEAWEELQVIAQREASGLWISFEEHLKAPLSPAVALRAIEKMRDNGHVESPSQTT